MDEMALKFRSDMLAAVGAGRLEMDVAIEAVDAATGYNAEARPKGIDQIDRMLDELTK